MDTRTVNPRRRRILEACIRGVDLVVYLAVFLGGIALVALPLGSATEALADYSLLMFLWAAFLIGGGLIGFFGRLTRYWMVETPATIASLFGLAIYTVVLAGYILTSAFAAFTMLIVLIAAGFMLRRWLELQIYSTEPLTPFRARLIAALKRRTQNAVPRTNP